LFHALRSGYAACRRASASLSLVPVCATETPVQKPVTSSAPRRRPACDAATRRRQISAPALGTPYFATNNWVMSLGPTARNDKDPQKRQRPDGDKGLFRPGILARDLRRRGEDLHRVVDHACAGREGQAEGAIGSGAGVDQDVRQLRRHVQRRAGRSVHFNAQTDGQPAAVEQAEGIRRCHFALGAAPLQEVKRVGGGLLACLLRHGECLERRRQAAEVLVLARFPGRAARHRDGFRSCGRCCVPGDDCKLSH